MTEPLSFEARGLIEQAVSDESALRADDARRGRLKQALLSGVAASGVGLLAGTSQAATAAQAAGGVVPWLPLLKGLGVGLLLSGAIAGSVHLVTDPQSLESAPSLATSAIAAKPAQPAAVARQAPELEPPQVVEPSVPQKVRPATPVAVEGAEVAEPALRAELALMSQVQAALRDNQGERALSLIQRYDASFSRGQLQTERFAAEVFAACQVGNVARARRAATQFLQRDSASPLAERVRSTCIGLEPGR